MSTNKNLPWASVWVTGAGRGIGEALAILFAQKGLTVYASSRTTSELEILQKRSQGYSGTIIPITLDITDPHQIEVLMHSWDQGEGLPELVILNAGTHDPFPAKEFSAQRCQRVFDINLQGTINCLDPVLKRMLKSNSGQLAVMASVAGYRGLPTAAAYGASKAALIHLCEALRLDLKDSNVTLQVINPGFVRTPLTDKNEFKMPALQEPKEAAESILIGLLSTGFEIAFPSRFVYFLKLLRIFPYRWYFALIGKTVKP
ncbi:SDR family NAD(P)-dependent oxidoreductase [Neptunomonas japonica]|uniref:SDR family NAD(P)-dependent oxidoreductase n=1 Tax=Neptunomonas japonica TaxID=417574 RepID=UPI00040F8C5E|nr:SDR family NAD(P)-dependent oxidoreductase [Neptunomonas japonica]